MVFDAVRGRDLRGVGALELPPDLAAAFAGAGTVREHLLALDWAATSVGPPATWPPELRIAMSVCLAAGYPIAVYWGPELTLLYNEAWSAIPGAKHPWALGRPAHEVWPDIWHIVGPEFAAALEGRASMSEDRMLPMRRHGVLEETYFHYNLSPIRSTGGAVVGVFNAGFETTAHVVAERRSGLLRDLSGRLAGTASVAEVCRTTAAILEAAEDVPFALVYATAGEGAFELVGAAGVGPGAPESPVRVAAGTGDPWSVRDVAAARVTVVVDDVLERVGAVTGGSWPEPPRQAVAMPLAKGVGEPGPQAVLVVGVHPGRLLDGAYLGFLDRLGDRVTAAIVDARAGEEALRVFEMEHRLATTLQQVLLPEALPAVPGVDLGARYLPSSAAFEVGGDWYDALVVPTGELAVVMGDVVGKGVPAAAMMGQLRNALRAYLLDGYGPAEALEHLHRFTMAVTSGNAFATVVCAFLDPATGALRWCRGGHVPPMLLRADGTCVELDEAGSPPVGAFPDVTFETAEAVLAPGESVVLCTDGLVETRELDLEAGMARLARSAGATASPVDLDALLDELVAPVDTTAQPDDVAVLVARRHPA